MNIEQERLHWSKVCRDVRGASAGTSYSMVTEVIVRRLPADYIDMLVTVVVLEHDGWDLALHVLQTLRPQRAAAQALGELSRLDPGDPALVGWWSVARACVKASDGPACERGFLDASQPKKYLFAGVLLRLVVDEMVSDEESSRLQDVVANSGDELSMSVLRDLLGAHV